MLFVQSETIWHFTCQSCLAWFSIATSDRFNPKSRKQGFYCPWCGEKSSVQTEQNDV